MPSRPDGGARDGDEVPSAREILARARTQKVSQIHLMRLREIADSLERARDVVDVHFEAGPPVPLVLLDTITGGLGIELPEPVESFYLTCDGFELRWHYLDEEGERHLGGDLVLFDFATTFDSWLGSLWGHFDEMSSEELDFIWELRGVDATPSTDDERMTVLHIEEDDPSYDLYVHDRERGTYRMDLDFVTYVECAIESRGIPGWQLLFCPDYDLDEDPFETGIRERFPELMRTLFPHEEPLHFQEFFEED
jgi:hypothetical protein